MENINPVANNVFSMDFKICPRVVYVRDHGYLRDSIIIFNKKIVIILHYSWTFKEVGRGIKDESVQFSLDMTKLCFHFNPKKCI